MRTKTTCHSLANALLLFLLAALPAHAATTNAILFVTQMPMPTEVNARQITSCVVNVSSPFGNHLGDTFACGRGGALWIRYSDGTITNLTALAGYGVASGFQGANSIAVREPHVHWNGTKALFSMVVGAPTSPSDTTQYVWQIYEITNFAVQGQLPTITKVPNQPSNYNNVSPTYGTDGRIIFASDRPRDGSQYLYPMREEYLHQPTVTGLWSLDPSDPNSLFLLQHSPSGSFKPFVDSFGRVIFTRWDHLSRDVMQSTDKKGQSTNYLFNYSSELSNAQITTNTTELFPEPRPSDTNALAGTNMRGNAFNQFFPWSIREDGTGEEVVNHIGRHEMLSQIPSSTFTNDPNIVTLVANQRFNTNYVANFFPAHEDPNNPGLIYGTDALDIGTHTAGQLVTLTAATNINADVMTIGWITPKSTAFPNASGLYRDPLPMSNGVLVAVYAPGGTTNDFNMGTPTAPQSKYDFRLRTMKPASGFFTPDLFLTPGFTNTFSYYVGTDLVTYTGPMWELDPVEVAARKMPVTQSHAVASVEAQVFADAGVDLAGFQTFLRTNNLALVVSRNTTARDKADKQQPYNLKVAWSGTQTLGSPTGSVYSIGYLQMMQADMLRGFKPDGVTPAPGRRVMGVPWHDDLDKNPPVVGGPSGSVQLGNDGSFAAILPARRAMSWQTTDTNGVPIVRERYWVTFQPGEVRTCANCHGANTQDQDGQVAPTNKPEALKTLLAWWKVVNVPQTPGIIAFMTQRDGDYEIYTMNPDGSNPVNLTHTNSMDAMPRVSYEGTKIVFMSDRGHTGNMDIWTMNPDGSGLFNVLKTNLPGASIWGAVPNGDCSKICYMGPGTNGYNLFVINADGTGKINLTNDKGDGSFPYWSYDGSKIVFGSYRDATTNYTGEEVYIMNANGSGQKRLTFTNGRDFYPVISPDGSKIAFTTEREGHRQIYLMSATDGSGQTNISKNAFNDQNAYFSPDGQHISFTSDRDGNPEVYVMNVDGSNQTRLTVTPGQEAYPAWGNTQPAAPPPPTFALVVNSGSGSGSYTNGHVVAIAANAPPAGQVFDQWTGATVANPLSSTTTLTMPGSNTTVTATYKALPPSTFTLTVNNGSGSGSYTNGQVVGIVASAPPAGQAFSQWTGATVANPSASSTTITMPGSNTTVTATYVVLPPATFTLTVNSGSGSGSYTNGQVVGIAANAPPAGQVFDKWTGATVANSLASSTTLTMPGSNTSVTATYKAAPPVTFTLTVNSGTGSGSYTNGQVVAITANASPAGQVFDKWTGATVANSLSSSTTLTMPAANTSVTATYKAIVFPPSTNGVIFFMTSRDGNYEMYSMYPDGSNAKNLTTNSAGDLLGHASYDGTKVVFMSDRGHPGSNDFWLINSDGSNLSNVTKSNWYGSTYHAPVLNADGSKIVFMGPGTNGYNIYTMNADGTGRTNVTFGTSDTFPAWSYDGSKIVFGSSRDNNNGEEIYIMNANGSGQTRLTFSSFRDSYPVMSPDGTKIAFCSERDAHRQIYLMNVNGSGQTNISNNAFSENSPWFSPDGQKIVFTSTRDGNSEVYVMNLDGSAQTRLTSNTFVEAYPSWGGTLTNLPPPPPMFALTVNSGTGSGSYTNGQMVGITANGAPAGQAFSQWTGAAVANPTAASTTITMPGSNVTVTATYVALPPPTFTLTVNSGSGSGAYTNGAVIAILANDPPAGQVFDQWTGATVASPLAASTTLTMPGSNTTVTATYKAAPPVTFTLTVNSGSGSGSYTNGQVVGIAASAPLAGQVFDQWTGATVANPFSSSTTLTMPASNVTVTATYKAAPIPTYTLTVNSGSGSGTYTNGQVVSITASAPPAGQVFSQWTGAVVANPTAASTTITMPASNTTVTATYVAAPPPTFTLMVNSGSGSGSYTNGQVVGIAANAPPAGQVFNQWTGASVANPLSSTTTLTMPGSNTSVTATYKAAPPPTFTLTVNSGSGSGSYTNGQVVGIAANAPPAGQVFNQWTGATVANPLAASTTLTMPGSNTAVTATYKNAEAPKFTLTVVSGSGSGSYTNGAVVPIVANPAPNGQVFSVWYGAAVANSNAASTTLTMPATNATVYATYKGLPGTLQFSSSTYSVNENGGSILITVTRANGSGGAVGVSYTTLDQVAKTGSDYTQKSGTLTWTNGDTSAKGFTITILNDALVEGTETLGLMLGAPTGGVTIGSPSTATVSIIDTTVPPQPSTNGVIVFQTSRNGAGEVYSMYPDGSNLKNLTQNSAQDTMPVISKDGTKIVFDSDRGHSGSFDIWTMNADGSGLFNVTKTNLSGAAVWAPALSPDNSKIVYMGPGVTSYNLWLVNSDGTNPKMLTQTAGSDTFPNWSPDGSKIVFSSFRDDSSAEEVYTMDANGSNVVRLTTSPGRDIYPVFSPDGTKIAFTSQRDGDREVYLMNADGTGQTNLTKNVASDQAAYFSPDGTKLVFTSTRDGNWEIYTMNLDGSGVTRITNNSAVDVLPSWGPMASPVQQSAIKSAVRALVASNNGETAEPVLNPGTWTIQPPSFDIGFCPGSGRRGKAVTVVGINFDGISEVLFNGVPAKFSVKSDMTILTKVPKGATTGPITLVGPNGTTTSMEDFEVEP